MRCREMHRAEERRRPHRRTALKLARSDDPVSECESDDSGLSSATSNSINNNNNNNEHYTKKPLDHSWNRIYMNTQHCHHVHFGGGGNAHYTRFAPSANHQQQQQQQQSHQHHHHQQQHSILFHNNNNNNININLNKRKHPPSGNGKAPLSSSSSANANCNGNNCNGNTNNCNGLPPPVRCHFPVLQHHFHLAAAVHQHQHHHSIAPDRFLMRAHLVQVKHAPANLLKGSKWDYLSQDIWNKFIEYQQTEQLFIKKMELWRFLYLTIKSALPRYSLYLVGSTVTGFGSDKSDMDLCLLVKYSEQSDCRSQAVLHLSTIQHFIQCQDVVSRSDLIHAKVPILKFNDNRFSLDVDLNCNNVVGIRNTHLLHSYAQLDWRVRPLVVVVKLWAQYNNINDAKNKTISSYSLVLMVLHYLQCGTSPALLPCLQKEFPDRFSPELSIFNIDVLEEMPKYKSMNEQTLGELFVGFLRYYTIFDYSQYAISVRTGRLLNIEECRTNNLIEPHQWKLLCVEEPFDLSNTARSVYDPDVFDHIRSVFALSHRALDAAMKLSSILPDNKIT